MKNISEFLMGFPGPLLMTNYRSLPFWREIHNRGSPHLPAVQKISFVEEIKGKWIKKCKIFFFLLLEDWFFFPGHFDPPKNDDDAHKSAEQHCNLEAAALESVEKKTELNMVFLLFPTHFCHIRLFFIIEGVFIVKMNFPN